MAWNANHMSVPFWDFMESLDNSQDRRASGAGIDHNGGPPGFDFGFGPGGFHAWAGRGGWGGQWGRRGGYGGPGQAHHGGPRDRRHEGRNRSGDEDTPDEDDLAVSDREMNEKDDSPNTMKETPDNNTPQDAANPPPPFHHRGGRCGRGRGRRGPHASHGPRGPHGPHGPHGMFGPHGPHHRGPPGPPPPPPFGGAGAFDFRPMMQAFANHPFAQALRSYAEQARNGATTTTTTTTNNNDSDDTNAQESDDVDVFVPPVDIFNTEAKWVLHLAIPGAKKEDVDVNWDAEKSLLAVTGVVYRPGDEEFLQSLVAAERRVGMFERKVTLPPPGSEDKDEVDALNITAKMEDGILVITVPKVEREWTEIRKVDIE